MRAERPRRIWVQVGRLVAVGGATGPYEPLRLQNHALDLAISGRKLRKARVNISVARYVYCIRVLRLGVRFETF